MRVLGQKKLQGGAKHPPPSLFRVKKGKREKFFVCLETENGKEKNEETKKIK